MSAVNLLIDILGRNYCLFSGKLQLANINWGNTARNTE